MKTLRDTVISITNQLKVTYRNTIKKYGNKSQSSIIQSLLMWCFIFFLSSDCIVWISIQSIYLDLFSQHREQIAVLTPFLEVAGESLICS